ncbi:alpha-L-fucosidase [Mucilaginibacter ginsenosidivorans]|uniref:alpha-L-fucosidase n=1 Tax=Mucilaginibacter ginsenosidivorans TaxID=398053 RepID=A0A5B8UR99_9SPHI|nr:alpha-L-fucosidase [Mucilaginibacter ginsenosidivorans]QEC61564.1 alpha-fucosidase [Mucilaginibacter ginsenosidivorans]
MTLLQKKSIVFIQLFVSISFVAVYSSGLCQQMSGQIKNPDFEASTIKPWTSVGNSPVLSAIIPYEGKQSIELRSGTLIRQQVSLKPLSHYRLTAWLKTASGSGDVRLNVHGLGPHDASVASAMAAWTQVNVDVFTGAGRQNATIEIENPENAGKNSAWADGLQLEFMGTYIPKKIAGISPPKIRNPKTDMGLTQQPNKTMDWLLDAKFGMFIHWGLYAGPGKGEWYMENGGDWNAGKGMLPEEYRKFAYPESGDVYFAADKFNADDWASLARDAGMKYMMMVTMHHDGYALFNTKARDAFSSKQTHNRDFVAEYVKSCRKYDLRVGLYKTLINWRYPGYYDIDGTDCKPNKFGYTTDPAHKENARRLKADLYEQVKELVTNYGKIDIIFWDGGWINQQGSDADAANFWESGKYQSSDNKWPVDPYIRDFDGKTQKPLGLMGMVRKYQPDVIVNPRSGWYGDFKSEEGGNPITGPVRTEEIWEKCMSIGPGWGYTPGQADSSLVMNLAQIKRMLSDCVIRNMSLLLNVGPDRHGQISMAEQHVLRETGKWLTKVGEAVYGTRGGPWDPKDGQYGYAYKGKYIYVYLLNGFKEKEFVLPALNKGQKVVGIYSLSEGNAVQFKSQADGTTILKNVKGTDPDVTVLAVHLNQNVFP